MTTAVDSSALLAILKGETAAEAWLAVLESASTQGPLVICETVAVEISPLFTKADDLMEFLGSFALHLVPATPLTCWEAGRRFARYRQARGPREHLIPDFLIAAHALHHADRLAASDRGFLRAYFNDLTLLQP